MLRISRQPSGEPEIFQSIQGEGVTIGVPSVFLRLAICNLACTWCDTKYTWDWDHYEYIDQVTSMSQSDIEQSVLKFSCKRLVITGGEPLVQQKELTPLTSSLSNKGLHCEVETNGTLTPGPEMIEAVSQWNVSPKLSNSKNSPSQREVPTALHTFSELDSAYFKFVVSEPSDLSEVESLVQRYNLTPSRVILMPEGITAQIVTERGRWLANTCVSRGYRFSTRLHILLWGDERGR